MSSDISHKGADTRQYSVGCGDSCNALAVVVVIVVDHGSVRLSHARGMSEQSTTTEEVDEDGIIGKRCEELSIGAHEVALLTLKRERSSIVLLH